MGPLFGILLAALGVILLSVTIVLYVSSRENALKNYTVLVLGPTASGKTVFLASMYRRLYLQRPETGFFIRAEDHEQAEQLDNFRSV